MSQYAQDLNRLLACLHEDGNEADDTQPLPAEEEAGTLHAYPGTIGGVEVVITSKQPLPPQYLSDGALEDDPGQSPMVESDPSVPPIRKAPPLVLLFCLLLSSFLLLDGADTALITLTTPTVTITITPTVKTVSLTSTTRQGKLLSPITVSQRLTVPATGHGHQDATRASGSVTFYNTSFTSQTVAAGTILTGADGQQIVTLESVTLPPDSPPVNGQATVAAQARTLGSSGNLPALDINGLLSSTLYVKNLAAFTGGQDARDFLLVTQTDRATAATSLQARVTASMSAALQGQLLPGQVLHPLPCSPAISADHAIGEEATSLTVTVSETCTAVAYDEQQVQSRATHLLTAQVMRTFGTGYLLSGHVQVTVSKAIASPSSPQVVLTFTCVGTFAYTLTAQAQQHLKSLLAGQPRLAALRWLKQQPGIQSASISGVTENQLLPDDLSHLHLLMVVPLW